MIETKSIGIRISEMAIRGQLSNRVKSSLSIDDIVENIRIERDSLIKEKATKISKVSDMLEVEPFDVPSNWKWVALGDLCILLSRGKSPKYSEVKKYPVFAQKCNQPNCLALDKALFLDETTLDKWPEYFRLRDSDVVINSTGTGTVGRVGYYTTESLDSNYEFMLPDSHVTVVRTGNNVSSRYIYYALRTATIQNIMEKTFRGSTNQKEFYIDSVYSIPIPLPPAEEQEEIVSILDDLFEQLSIIDDLQTKYINDLAVLKSKIIDAGIRGKLTGQLPEDGDADTLYAQIQEKKAKLIKEGKIKKEKTLQDIAVDEIPFEIPKNWKWVRLGELVSVLGDGIHGTPKYDENGEYFFVNGNNLVERKIVIKPTTKRVNEDEYKKYKKKLTENTVLVSINGTLGNLAFYNNEWIILGKSVCYFNLLDGGLKEYIYYVLKSNYFSRYANNSATGVTIKNVSLKAMNELYIPLPPLLEQKRIVKKINQLLDS